MQEKIPIILTKKKLKQQDLIFKIPKSQFNDKDQLLRHPSVRKPRNLNIQSRHQTLDSQNLDTRTGRISSSAASKRFPKDFFKDQNSFHKQTKSNRLPHKQHQPILFDTFSKKTIITMHYDQQEQKRGQLQDTPRFRSKEGRQMTTKQKIFQYIKKKNIQDNTKPTQKHNTCPQMDSKVPLGLYRKQPNNNQAETVPISTFTITLGQKQSLMNMIERQKQKRVRKKEETLQKENNNYLIPFGGSQSKREAMLRLQGFRIRKRFLN